MCVCSMTCDGRLLPCTHTYLAAQQHGRERGRHAVGEVVHIQPHLCGASVRSKPEHGSSRGCPRVLVGSGCSMQLTVRETLRGLCPTAGLIMREG